MLTKKKWALFSLLTLCGGTIYKLPSLKDAFYIPMQEYFHLTNGQIGNAMRSEEHTSELQSHHDLVCRLLLEKKNERRK